MSGTRDEGKGKEKDKTLYKSAEQEIESYKIKKRKRKYIDRLINASTDPETKRKAAAQMRIKSQGFVDNLESALQKLSSPSQQFFWQRAISYTISCETTPLLLKLSSKKEMQLGELSEEGTRLEREVEEAAATLIQANAQTINAQANAQATNKAIFDNFLNQFNDFIGFKNGSSLSTTLSHLINNKNPEEVEDFFAHSKYFLRNYIYESNDEIMNLYKNDQDISDIKGRVQQAENMYLALKKLEKNYYKADRERSYFEANNKHISGQLVADANKKRITKPSFDYDAKHTVENTGIALSPQYWAEKVDPQHRHWGSINKQLDILKENWRDTNTNQNLFDFVLDGSIAKDKYLDETQRKDYLVKIKDGKIVFTSDSTPPTENVELSYVIDLRGNLYIEKEKQISHPSFLAGENAKCAGKLFIQDGKIISINNDSNYYSPGPFSLNSALTILEKNNMLDFNVIVEDFSQKNIVGCDLDTYRKNCSMLEDNSGITFLNTVKDINLYMKKRAKETQEYGFMSKLFGYSGQDYYDRRKHWESVLEGLLKINSETSLTTVLRTINAGINQFGKNNRKDYANKLTALRDHLTPSYLRSLSNKKYINKYLKSSTKVYKNLGSLSESVHDFTTTEDKTTEYTSLSTFTHQLSGHRLKAKGRSEFLTKAEVRETEFTNSLSGRYKRV